ncbi:MAG: 2-keto-3-deoxy-L-rhamnonate aldolase [Saprospiraceae bacterium]|nr:2-keto-3-deoxy-L-rhamnonate aldolase [Bacteroidia bacterium]NNK89190.1 2-keto-3-deoxy-L-rhamnonate aldolase [Saprospiraceae bacterium]
MNININRFKSNINTGRTQFGLWNGLTDLYAAEILAGAGFDFVLIDAEHGPFDLRTIISQLQAMSKFSVSPIIRPPVGDPVIIKQLLDAGAQTLLIPMVETAAQAEMLVKSMLYPPRGIRGVGTALSRAAQWNRTNNYFRDADEQMCLLVQVESVAGYNALDEILAVDGIDGVFIGPADLAGSMGFLGQPTHPEVIDAVERGLDSIRLAGKAAGTLAVTEDLARQYEEAGANIIGVGVDLVILAKATKSLAEKYKPELKNITSNTKY